MITITAEAIEAAVNAYDAERVRLNRFWHNSNCLPMSDENKANITPMIAAAVKAALAAERKGDAG